MRGQRQRTVAPAREVGPLRAGDERRLLVRVDAHHDRVQMSMAAHDELSVAKLERAAGVGRGGKPRSVLDEADLGVDDASAVHAVTFVYRRARDGMDVRDAKLRVVIIDENARERRSAGRCHDDAGRAGAERSRDSEQGDEPASRPVAPASRAAPRASKRHRRGYLIIPFSR